MCAATSSRLAYRRRPAQQAPAGLAMLAAMRRSRRGQFSTNTYGITPIGLSVEAALSPALGNRAGLHKFRCCGRAPSEVRTWMTWVERPWAI